MKKVLGYIFVPNCDEPLELAYLDIQANDLQDAETIVQALCKKLGAKHYLITV